MVKIDLTITIPTINEEQDIGDCLKSIAMQDYPKDKFEVIIVDDGSTDDTLKIVESFNKKLNIRVLSDKNKPKDAESSKLIGYNNSRGKYFMYLDADMRFATKDFIKKMLFPFEDDKEIAGNFVRFKVNKNHPALTRTLSYDEFQRDPIFKFFTVGIKKIIMARKKGYFLCYCDKNIPPQSLMIYRKDLIKYYAKTQKQLIDNEIPAVLVEQGHKKFAYVPSTGVYHLLLRSYKELWYKRVRNLERTYYPNIGERKFKWIDWKKDWPKIIIWMLYTNSIILPMMTATYKTLKYRDSCFLNEPLLNLVSTYSIIYGVLKKK